MSVSSTTTFTCSRCGKQVTVKGSYGYEHSDLRDAIGMGWKELKDWEAFHWKVYPMHFCDTCSAAFEKWKLLTGVEQ